MAKALEQYIQKFKKLRQGVTKYGPAPHKAILLLSVLRAIETGYIANNHISVSPLLVSLFKTTWNVLVRTQHAATFTLPFFHLKSEGFWHLHAKPGFDNWLNVTKSLDSLNQLRIAVDYAHIDGELFILLLNTSTRNELKQVLLETYFNDTQSNWPLLAGKTYLDEISENIIKEKPAEYTANLLALESELDKDGIEEEMFMRSAAFHKQVTEIYNYTCCISGFRIDAISGSSLLDACHILPFAESHDDTISNGLALSPTLHRAFDRHLITIDEDYRVKVAKSFVERCDSPYSIRQFEGKHILLPANKSYYPSLENLSKHKHMLME